MKKLNDLFYSFLQVAASTQKLGINLIRISILIIFVWIGGSGIMKRKASFRLWRTALS